MINTIGKKMHTLVKENTPLCHKIRQKCGFTQKGCILLHIIVFSSPLLCEYWQGVKLMLPYTYQEINDTHTVYMPQFFKNMSKCVFILEILKSQCNFKFITLWGPGSTCSKKRLAGRSFFQNLGSQGPGRVSPGGSSRAAPSSRFLMFF